MKPACARVSAKSLPLPLDPRSSGEFQSRSVGPLPAMNTTPQLLLCVTG